MDFQKKRKNVKKRNSNNMYCGPKVLGYKHHTDTLNQNDLESRLEVIQGHRFWYQLKARIRIHISGQ